MTIERQNLAINGTPEFKEITLSGAEPLKAKTNQSLTMFADVTGTISLGGVGATLAVTTLSVTTVEATAMDGGLDITIANGVNDVPLNIVNNDTTNNPDTVVILNNGTGDTLKIQNVGNKDFIVTGNGDVGIGVASSSIAEKLHISKTINGDATVFRLENGDSSSSTLHSVGMEFYLNRNNIGFAFAGAAIRLKKDQAWTGTGSTIDGNLVIETRTDEAAGLQERVTFFHDGAVKIHNLTGSSDVQTDASSKLITVSDSKAKNFKGDVTNAINTILKLKPVKYTYKHEDKENIGKTKIGFFADEVAKILKEGATLNPITNLYGLNSQAILGTLVQAFKDHIANSHYDN